MATEYEGDDLSDVIDALATGIYTVRRTGPTIYVDGRRQAPVTTSLSVRGVVYPTSGIDLQRLPEGLRTVEIITIVSPQQLRTAGPEGEPDIIEYKGLDYQVQTSQRWTSGNFFFCLASKVITQ